MLFNISVPDDSLRRADCAANILHTYPSDAMLSDALVQYLASKDWLQILVLHGPRLEDAGMVAALRRSAKKFRARIVDTKPFLLTNDPLNREQSNIALTSGERHASTSPIAAVSWVAMSPFRPPHGPGAGTGMPPFNCSIASSGSRRRGA